MPLRPFANMVRGESKQVAASDDTALVFVLNSDFIPGLKVLLYSMAVHETLLDLPIIVISEQADVFRDPIVAAVADKTRLATEEDIDHFRNISSDKVDAALRLEWIPKYTYLKWLMFEDYGFKRHIFIDADIVCLGSLDPLLDLWEHDIYGGPVFTRDLYAGPEGPFPQAKTDETMALFTESSKPPGSRLNTGVLVVNQRLLSASFRRDLIRFAEQGSYSVEQAALRSYVRESKKFTLRLFSPSYNFNHGYLERVSPAKRFELLTKVNLLHFAGAGKKPWEKPGAETLADYAWFAYANAAASLGVVDLQSSLEPAE